MASAMERRKPMAAKLGEQESVSGCERFPAQFGDVSFAVLADVPTGADARRCGEERREVVPGRILEDTQGRLRRGSETDTVPTLLQRLQCRPMRRNHGS